MFRHGVFEYPPSYYAATANEQTAYPQLKGSVTTDVCIIGAGFTGLSSAGRFVPADDSKLVNRSGAGKEIAAPRYSPDDLRRIMGRFAIDRAMLLANGMQEFLFRLQS